MCSTHRKNQQFTPHNRQIYVKNYKKNIKIIQKSKIYAIFDIKALIFNQNRQKTMQNRQKISKNRQKTMQNQPKIVKKTTIFSQNRQKIKCSFLRKLQLFQKKLSEKL